MRRWHLSALGAALCLAGVAQGAGTQMELTAVAGNPPGHYAINSPALTATGAVSSAGVNGTASATATIGMGEIHAQSQASAPAPYGTARSTISAKAHDEVSASGIPNTNVLVRWFLPVSGTGSETGMDGYAHADFDFFSGSSSDDVGLKYQRWINSGAVVAEGYFGSSGSVDYVDATYQVGQNYLVQISYDGDIGVTAGASGSLDYANTAHAYAQVLTPGATLSFESGHDYAAPVPEPATFAALGLGALGLLRRRRRA